MHQFQALLGCGLSFLPLFRPLHPPLGQLPWVIVWYVSYTAAKLFEKLDLSLPERAAHSESRLPHARDPALHLLLTGPLLSLPPGRRFGSVPRNPEGSWVRLSHVANARVPCPAWYAGLSFCGLCSFMHLNGYVCDSSRTSKCFGVGQGSECHCAERLGSQASIQHRDFHWSFSKNAQGQGLRQHPGGVQPSSAALQL